MVNIKKAKILFRSSLFGIVLCILTPYLSSKLGYEYHTISFLYGMFFVYSLMMSIIFHFMAYGHFLMTKTKEELLDNLKEKGSVSVIAFMLLFWNMISSLFCLGLLVYSFKEKALFGMQIDKEMLMLFTSFGLCSFYLVQKDRLGKSIGYLVCRYC